MFVVVLLIGGIIVASQPTKYSATTTVVILPSPSIGVDQASNYYDTLSHGQIEATASQILSLKKFKTGAVHALGLSARQASGITVQVAVQAGTALLNVTVSAPTGRVAERVADEVVVEAAPTVNTLSVPYQISTVSKAGNTAQTSRSLSLGKFVAVLLIVAVALAIGAQQAANQLVLLRRRRSTATASVAPPLTGHSNGADTGRRTKRPAPPVAPRPSADLGRMADNQEPADAPPWERYDRGDGAPAGSVQHPGLGSGVDRPGP
ncbi:MAG: hypothetical protein M3Y36_03640 [Actinomycetota bacterium]|nr:hypothetical protein [Actinomycetota bacterium]